MKVDLTPREIELILLILNDVAASDFEFEGSAVFSSEELSIISKLEMALKQNKLTIDLSELGLNGLRH
ncbi:MAG TPA: hypothetical protein DEE98_06250 [Elusimicrobia bacterium]|nr:MAG: hypothetical protein A2278_02155 [Elusimicrobia bacterium RIFOXYA12_FULL_49_49]OGS09245.1 MAG: hypothetical protein A2204_07520 [Elusimicrobia bacterium RIFOXYA1_FULL_47_7]OGS11894.1 MAG: hypothetical protein A2386_00875 [Elusimicrobia bacterium RIFOXYB1_FULL_48_9]OGS16850.1 MAG: hypothetical protein A2251_05605 [Elusimicrobia bacterium RIFOXYA2_FULL_47_53]OGS32078.1 MAG: hypothetical protein A2323_08380 [Elusimicrobia bacterium RIFOXYB2_FULL_46_23]HBU69971.1 hypothetical protein [Elus